MDGVRRRSVVSVALEESPALAIGSDEQLYLLYDRDQDQDMDAPQHVRVIMVGPAAADLRGLELEFVATMGPASLTVLSADWFAGWLVEHKAFRVLRPDQWRSWSMW